MIIHSDESIEVRKLLERICVRPPYFALRDISWSGTSLVATARAETPRGDEQGPMSAAEVGRHAAIAGLCSVALSQGDQRRRYYLARRAECDFQASDAPFGSAIRFSARLSEFGKREARVAITADVKGRPIASFDITYSILTQETFGRLFSARRTEALPAVESYDAYLPGELTRGNGWAEYRVPQVPKANCAGHFETYPALPVAVLMGQLSRLAGSTMAQSDVPYWVTRCSVEAKDLCWAGESATFKVERLEQSGRQQQFSCVALAENRVVGSMELVLELA